MSTPVAKLGSIERALMALMVRDLEALGGSDVQIGGEFPRVIDDFYVRIDRVSGGRANSFEGDFVVDVEVFSEDYLRAEDVCEDIESILLAHGIVSVVTGGKRWVFDGIFQNIGITDIPWEGDDDTHRLMARYAFTVRRGGITLTPPVTPETTPAPAPAPEPDSGTIGGTDGSGTVDAVLMFENALI